MLTGARSPQAPACSNCWPNKPQGAVSGNWDPPNTAQFEYSSLPVQVPDPVDARARIIELTPRGRQALRVMRSNALDLEKRWQQILGERRLGELRETLQMLLASKTEAAGA